MVAEVQTTHINHALLAKGHPRRHLIHKFWARKPHNVVAEYIKHYTKEGDIVLDPFVGSGVTAVEALILGRKAIAIDLNPISTFMTRIIAKPIDLKKFQRSFTKIEKNVGKEIANLYKTICNRCKGEADILATIWEREEPNPIELRIYCSHCKTRRVQKPSAQDINRIKEIESKEIPYWYPKVRLCYPSGKEYKEGTHIGEVDSTDKLFTRRNLLALSILYQEIERIEEDSIRDLMKLTFTSMVHLASIMCPVAKPSPRAHWSEFSATSFWPVHRCFLKVQPSQVRKEY